ncbi:G-protein coupled receptor 12-like [Exaiptasia diaphana]|uniref:G-protein coupled receptors family 1 profile domain-containing protein n=1 Tax=Exaiptasia diaphana TaxID=2652724 RepID=A0A913YBB0_EXADI|nr:G-protein coupled receptor 12-like [Exaiptasia diaphana]
MNNSTLQPPASNMVEGRDFFITLMVINAFSGFLATVLNLLIIVTLIKTPSLRTPSNILILNLSITDFGVGALVQPVYSIVIFAHMNKVLLRSQFVLNPVTMILSCASLLTITVITVDRFLALLLSLRYQEIVTKRRTSKVVIMIWTFSVSLPCILLAIFSFFKKIKDYDVVVVQINNFLFLSLFLLNIALMLKISSIINRHSAQIQVQQQAMNAQPGAAGNIKRSVNMMYFILGTFFLCYFPCICFRIIAYFSLSKIAFVWQVVSNVVFTILCMNSSINPIIYFWRIPDMRNAALQLLRSIRRNNNNINDNNNNRDAENDVYVL